jgi:hypothetical protein
MIRRERATMNEEKIKSKQCNTHCFDFDHRDKETKVGTISDLVINACSMERILTEINKCDLLCVICHS